MATQINDTIKPLKTITGMHTFLIGLDSAMQKTGGDLKKTPPYNKELMNENSPLNKIPEEHRIIEFMGLKDE